MALPCSSIARISSAVWGVWQLNPLTTSPAEGGVVNHMGTCKHIYSRTPNGRYTKPRVIAIPNPEWSLYPTPIGRYTQPQVGAIPNPKWSLYPTPIGHYTQPQVVAIPNPNWSLYPTPIGRYTQPQLVAIPNPKWSLYRGSTGHVYIPF